ncbi:MAG: 5-(carboxyamino)imidazole ribonucleotide synthase [Alicyclobacillus sp.]|nr:5-(carboxyamino)imidazole ribonucleotide synthase [Alicyclobacillus sp.]
MRREQAGPLRPGCTIGILGGGQLGRMVALEAKRMGYRVVTLDPVPDCPCGQIADDQVVAAYTDVAAAQAFAARCDVVLYEFEDVDDAVVAAIEAEVSVPQGSRLLAVTRHRLREKLALTAAGVAVAPSRPIRTAADLRNAATELGLPLIVKTTTGGYDGKGQWEVPPGSNLDAVWAELARALPNEGIDGGQTDDAPVAAAAVDAPLIAEAKVPFVCEASVVVARNSAGDVRCFPLAENVHVDHILHLSICPARVPDAVQAEAERVAVRVAEHLQVVGLLAVEMFVLDDGRVLVNELAPRPHNSGHYTMDACVTSQFEQLVRIVCGLPLGSTRLLTPVVMGNLLGKHLPALQRALSAWPDTFKLHLYGKAEARPQRKMGHVNVIAPSTSEALREMEASGIWESALQTGGTMQ